MSNTGSLPMDRNTEIGNVIDEKQSLPLSAGEGEGFPMPESTLSGGGGGGGGDGEGSAEIMPVPFQNEGVNASADVEALSPNLFRVMCIVPDKQDYSFVEKVQLPDHEVLSLCNKLVPSSAAALLGNPPRVRINFNALNQLSLPTVGFYGDKEIMIRIFRKESLVDETVLAKMEGRLFDPGFYVSIPENAATVVVFHWHEGEHFKEASRKDASCNFIRYLVELCGSVYICVEGSYPFEALAASATSASSKAKRARRFQVRSVKNSENNLELLPGFNVGIDGGASNKNSLSLPNASTASVNNYNTSLVFCEGYHHCCFLRPEDRAPRKSTKIENVSVKVPELGNMLERWSMESKVDYSRLSNQHFINLLECCHPQEYQDYCNLKNSFTESAIKSARAEEFGRCFLKVLPEFCSHVLLFLGRGTSDDKDKDTCSFDQLHRELSLILAEDDGDQRVLLSGADIRFTCSNGEHTFALESQGQGKQTLPFIRYDQEVNVKCSSQCSCSDKIDARAKIRRPINETRHFPLSGEKVNIVLPNAKLGERSSGKVELEGAVHVVNNNASVSAIRSWVENIVPVELKTLERNLAFTAFLFSQDEHMALIFMENHLETQNIQSLSPNIRWQFQKFQNAHTASQSTINQEALLSHETLKTVCCRVYKDQENKFLQTINELSSVLLCRRASNNQEQKSVGNIRYLIGRLGGLIKSLNPGKEIEEERRFKQSEDRFVEEMERRFKQAENEFVQESKMKMTLKDKTDALVTRYIDEVTVQRNEWLKLRVSTVEEHQFAIVWKACELTPMRKDINELNNNSWHPILPKCSDSFELVAINPGHERLFNVVVLKSGELLVFIHNIKDSCLHLYHCPKLGFNINNMKHPIYTFRRGFDLLAVDESTRSLALYEKEKNKIKIYKFDESFRKVFWTGVEINLESYKGSKIITWMHLIPGKMELLLVDDTNSARVTEIREKPMMKAKHISLPLQQPPLQACVSVDGFFFIVFRQFQCPGDNVDVAGRRHASPDIVLEVYVLGDIMSHLKTIHLDAQASSISDLEKIEAKITSFGSQSQLLLYNPVDAPGFISSHVLKTALAKEVVQLQQLSQNKSPEQGREETEIVGSCPYLGYIYHIFDKFATTPAMFPDYTKCITFKVVLESTRSDPRIRGACIKYLKALIRQLKAGKDKDFSNMKIEFQVDNAENCLISVAAEEEIHVKMGMWVRKLVCLVPIQIARAENNGMVALKDGLQIPHYISYVDSVSLANSIRFGFYDAVLNSWKGKIKVISSMGKQSSGKSYLLNHLSGSLLDVAGGRCTDGVWMTITTGEDGDGQGDSRYLYVLLDFEGLGSFERSEQEDMLLSVLNAAVSNLTIFNKKDFHLDKDTESAFSRFQSGINLLKQDKKLFKGVFYIAIKDVDTSDVDDLQQEFLEKISQICSRSQDNFISKMYDGKFEIAAMAPYNRSDYYKESLRELAETVADKIYSCYDNGSTFLRDLKLIIAQIAAKDWTSIDSKRVAVIVDILRRNLISGVYMGCLSVNANEELQVFVNFDTEDEIPDLPVVVGNLSCDIKDSGLYLAPSEHSAVFLTKRDVLFQIRSRLEMVLPRKGTNGEVWHSMFENLLNALSDRRHARVQQWISSNTIDFRDNDEVQRLQLEADVALGKVKQDLCVCGCKCSVCFWRCVLEKGHGDDHSCMSSHSCAESCTYCAREGSGFNVCKDLAGHEGSHDCKEKNHTCQETCHLFEMSSNCNKSCSLRPEHPGQHKCNSPQHMCTKTCSLSSCNNPCAVPIESNHTNHQCHERYCPKKCSINGCSRTCGVKDHFHDWNPDAEHLCGNEHACPNECEMRGICEIFTELVKQTRVFQGQRGSFEYELVSEQNGLRKGCCIPIPPFERDHQGPHVHTKNEDSVHYCDSRCQACGYFCQLPIDHSGLHDTVHGNMRNVRFISEGEDIEIHDRKYKWGEKGEAEMCNMYCKKQGRGHIHLVLCRRDACTSSLRKGSRHETVKYGPDVDNPKDEMTHKTYWEYVEFVDPCTEEEREEIGRCNHYCKSEEHEAEAGGSNKSYCIEELWHDPIKRAGQNLSSAGYITDDGHHFSCDHSKNVPHHVIFVIDRSGSMGSSEISPTMEKFNKHNYRLGCVYEAILRFIRVRLRTVSADSVSVVLFDTSADVAVEMENMEEGLVDRLLGYYPGGGTTFQAGLDATEKILMKGARHHTVDVKKPVIIFLSDGGNNGGGDPLYYVDKMKRQEPRMTLHTIMYGTDPTMKILVKMAKEGGGTFEQALDEIQLARSFENLAESLKPQVAALM